ncbi:lycopene beta-cyclase CrtY [Pirellulaceae bacterium SH449]
MTLEVDELDYILVGGGLQSGLMALAIGHHQPGARVAILERGSVLGGNHTWSFHSTDVSEESSPWIQPLVESRWPEYDVFVGKYQRRVRLEYYTVSSSHFASVLGQQASNSRLRIFTGAQAIDVSSNEVRLSNGQQLRANVVIDNRGPQGTDIAEHKGGFQKFWGFEVELDHDWFLPHPRIMDDSIEQTDGFRFLYTLPFEPRRVLVEDTRFSNSTHIDRGECLQQVTRYLSKHGYRDWRVLREESGVLPMPTDGKMPGYSLPTLAGGYRGGWFHAATGYSMPMAIQLASLVATTPPSELQTAWKTLQTAHHGRAKFARFLNRLLFDLVKPQTRYQIFRRFYSVLGESRIARFYGHRFTCFDAFRIVVGIPPRGLRPIQFFRSYLTSNPQISVNTNTPITNEAAT